MTSTVVLSLKQHCQLMPRWMGLHVLFFMLGVECSHM